MQRKKLEKKNCKDKPYTEGQINMIVDAFFHPLYVENEWVRVVDGVIHELVEGNARISAKNSLNITARNRQENSERTITCDGRGKVRVKAENSLVLA